MDTDDAADRIDLAHRLMVEITIRLENLAERAAGLQRSTTANPKLGEDVEAVRDLIAAYRRLLPDRSSRARSKT